MLRIHYPDGKVRHFMDTQEYHISKAVERRAAAKKAKLLQLRAREIKLSELREYLEYLEGGSPCRIS